MDQDLHDRLDRIEKMVSDNNRLLSKMRKAQKKAVYWRVLYWIVFIGLAIVSIYYVEPYISQFGAEYGIGTGNGTTTSPSTTSTVLNMVKQYEASQTTGK